MPAGGCENSTVGILVQSMAESARPENCTSGTPQGSPRSAAHGAAAKDGEFLRKRGGGARTRSPHQAVRQQSTGLNGSRGEVGLPQHIAHLAHRCGSKGMGATVGDSDGMVEIVGIARKRERVGYPPRLSQESEGGRGGGKRAPPWLAVKWPH